MNSAACPRCGRTEYEPCLDTADLRRCCECGTVYTIVGMEPCVVTTGTIGGNLTTQRHHKAPLEDEIRTECEALADFLVEKNRAYGNSASEPCRIFAKRVDPLAQIDCRIDDKLSRLMKGSEYPGDNDVKDLTGYLILRMIVEKKQKKDGCI